ncbi:MAG: glycosyltransferase family 4 protein [Clostridia bacterium]|nr:glycosyltransferase family 4 protein [Clostridia bacterium]
MKITHVISDSNVGGAGILLCTLLSGLADEFDFEVILPEGSRLASRLPAEKIKITELPVAPDKSFSPRDISTFYRYLRATRPDVVHTHASLTSRIGAAALGIHPCISTRHCAKPTASIKKQGVLQRIIYNLCTDITISTADFAKDNLICEGVNERKITTIKNGSPTCKTTTEEEKADLLARLDIPQGARIVGTVARLEEVKGQDLTLRAAREITEAFGDVYFVFVGDGNMADTYRRLTSLLGIEERVRFTGYTSEPHKYQSLFYINLNSSRGTETSPLAISECMAMGIPTVASDFGGNREMIRDGENGLLFECENTLKLANALCRLLSDGDLYRSLSFGARESYEKHFSAERMVDDYRRLYKSLKIRH